MNRYPQLRRFRRAAGVAFGLAVLALPAVAQPRLGPAKQQEITLEKHYQFYVRGYRRPLVFDPGALTFEPREVTARPSELAVRALSARAQGEVEAYLDLWTEDARTALLGAWEQQGISPQQMGERWRAETGGLHVEFIHYVDFDLADLIHYRLFDPTSGQERGGGELAFRIADDGLWRLFVPEDQLFLANWRFDGARKTIDLAVAPVAQGDRQASASNRPQSRQPGIDQESRR